MITCSLIWDGFRVNKELFLPLTIMGSFLVIFFTTIYFVYQFNKASQIRMKNFSVKFSKLILQGAEGTLGYNNFLRGMKTIELKNHPDFQSVRCTEFFKNFISEIENIMIPTATSYGYCAILVANYKKIRKEVTHRSFLSEARYNLLKIYLICDKIQLNTILIRNQDMIYRHKSILDYSYLDLTSTLSFVKLYFLYLYSLEDPTTARNLNARNFYNFVVLPTCYCAGGCHYHYSHQWPPQARCGSI